MLGTFECLTRHDSGVRPPMMILQDRSLWQPWVVKKSTLTTSFGSDDSALLSMTGPLVSSLSLSLGAIEVGVIINFLLYGVSVAQCYIYLWVFVRVSYRARDGTNYLNSSRTSHVPPSIRLMVTTVWCAHPPQESESYDQRVWSQGGRYDEFVLHCDLSLSSDCDLLR